MRDPTEEYRYCEPADSDRLAALAANRLLRSQLAAAVIATHLQIIAAKLRARDEPPYEVLREVLMASAEFFDHRASKQPPAHIPDFGDRYNAQWFRREAASLDDRYERDEASILRGDFHTIDTLDPERFQELLDLIDGAAVDAMTTPTTKGSA